MLSNRTIMMCLLLSILGLHTELGVAACEIESKIGSGEWSGESAIYPLSGQSVQLRVKAQQDSTIRWFQIVADTRPWYHNAGFPGRKDAYKWLGYDRIKYKRKELADYRGKWQISLFSKSGETNLTKATACPDLAPSPTRSVRPIGTYWFQVEITRDGARVHSPGIEESDERGISPIVFRVSYREDNSFLGWVTSFFHVPSVFGSTTYQSKNYIGVDCADVLMQAYSSWKGVDTATNLNVQSVVRRFPAIAHIEMENGRPSTPLRWREQIKPGDLIAVRYSGQRAFQHIGALYSDANCNGYLDRADLVLDAGPYPLTCSRLKDRSFDGSVVILRPK